MDSGADWCTLSTLIIERDREEARERVQKERARSGGAKRLYYFRGCSPPRSSLLQVQGGKHTKLVTYGFWGGLVQSLYPRGRERQRRGKRESKIREIRMGEKGSKTGLVTPNQSRMDSGANRCALSMPIIIERGCVCQKRAKWRELKREGPECVSRLGVGGRKQRETMPSAC